MGQYTVKKCILKNEEGEFLSPFVIPASNEEIGTVKPDGKSIIISEDGTIEAKNVLIAGDNIQIDENNLLTASGGKDLFDVVMKDHILTYEEKKGYELLGEYVYKSAIAGERYGYPDFYNKCLEEYNEATETKKYWIKNNINNTGVTVDKSVISNFTKNGMASIPTFFHGTGYFEFQIKFKLTNNTVINPLLCTSVNYDGLMLRINAKGLLTAYVSTNGSSWNEIDGKTGTHVFETGVDYWVKGEYKTTNGIPSYTFSYSTDGINFTQDIYDYNIGDMYAAETEYRLGQDYTTNYLQGEIDLAETYIKQSILNGVNNNWNGCDFLEVKKHENGHEFYDISIKDTVDEYYAENKIAWFLGIDETNECICLPRNDFYPNHQSGEFYPDLSRAEDITAYPFTAPEDGWFIMYERGTSLNVFINGVHIDYSYFSANNWPAQGNIQIPVKKGDVISNSAASLDCDWFVPMKKNDKPFTNIYLVVGNTISNTAWIDVVSQVEEGTLDIYEAKQISLNEIERTKTNAINEVEATGLGNKADIDLANLSEVGKKVIDGEWISNILMLSTETAAGTYELDLSTILPNDGYNYEIMVDYAFADAAERTLDIYSDLIPQGTVPLARITSGGTQANGRAIILVGLERKLYLYISGAIDTNLGVEMLAYRRLGSNQ